MIRRLKKFKKLLIITLVVSILIGISVSAHVLLNPRVDPFIQNIQVKPSSHMDAYELLINNEVVIRLRSIPQGLSAYERSNVVVNRIHMFINQGSLSADNIKIQLVNEIPALTVGGQVLVTAADVDLQANNSTAWNLLETWQNNFKRALFTLEVYAVPPIQPSPIQPAPDPNQMDYILMLTEDEQKMLSLVNQERVEAGLPELRVHPELVVLARLKSQDMIDNDYFAHESPVHGLVFDMLESAGISYTRAGENLAGSAVVERAHTNLMNSPGHRSNILNRNFTYIGIGIVEGGPFGKMFTQIFIRP